MLGHKLEKCSLTNLNRANNLKAESSVSVIDIGGTSFKSTMASSLSKLKPRNFIADDWKQSFKGKLGADSRIRWPLCESHWGEKVDTYSC
jgi:hypothetical protein